MPTSPYSYDRAVHSDFLIHWTGKDIDKKHDPKWRDRESYSETIGESTDPYLKRLRDILTYGLWMTEESERNFTVGSKQITMHSVPQCCFTELKLSESRRHAAQYGRLGIGVKRPFAFQRFGRPLVYFGFGEQKVGDLFLEACAEDLKDKRMLRFFKPMNEKLRPLTYELYGESEWRILAFERLISERKIIDPRDEKNEKEYEYFQTLPTEDQNKLKYLIPLDGWFAMVIYPSLSVKNRAQWDDSYGVMDEIRRIKTRPNDHGNRVENRENLKYGNWPIELDLDSCRNF